MDFEKAMTRLETIVSHLESGDSGLEESLKLYEEGMKLSSDCQKTLSKAERKVFILKNGINPNDEKSEKKKMTSDEITKKIEKTFDLFNLE